VSKPAKPNILKLFDDVVEVHEKPRLESYINRGKKYWRIEIGKAVDGKRIRPSLGKDETYARSVYAEIIERLGSGDIKGIGSAVEELKDYDSKAARRKLRAFNVSLERAAGFYAQFHRPTNGHISLKRALEIWEENARKLGHSDTYIKKMLNTYAGPFVRKYPGLKVMDVTYKEAEDYIFKHKRTLGNGSKGETIRKLRGWFNALADLKYSFKELNPFEGLKAPKDKFGETEEVNRAIPPALMQVILDYALSSKKQTYIEVLTSIVLRAFCGVRSEEIVKLDWENITLDDDGTSRGFDKSLVSMSPDLQPKKSSKVKVPKLASKMGYQRNIEIPENARCWLVEAVTKTKNPTGPIVKNWQHNKGKERSSEDGYLSRMNDFLKDLKKYCEENKIPWKKYEQNGFRASCASYGLHYFGKETICRMMGEKRDSVFWNNYQEYVEKDDADRFFRVLPEPWLDFIDQFKKDNVA
jgi:integrase